MPAIGMPSGRKPHPFVTPRTPALSTTRGGQGRPGRAAPEERRLALVRQADRGDAGRVPALENRRHRSGDGIPEVLRLLLHAPRLGEPARDLDVPERDDGPARIEEEGGSPRRPLVDAQDQGQPGRSAPCAAALAPPSVSSRPRARFRTSSEIADTSAAGSIGFARWRWKPAE